MHNRLFLCPFTKRVISPKSNNIGSYIRHESRKRNITKEELRTMVYLGTFPEFSSREKLYDYYINKHYSLPMFLNEFGIAYHIILFLLDYYSIPKRNLNEANKLGAIRTKQTNLKRYGVDQTFKVPEFDAKRRKTYLERYGVDNPFKVKGFISLVEQTYFERYGCSLKERRSMKSKEVWASCTETEKQEWLESSILSEPGATRIISRGNESRLETWIHRILSEMNIPYSTQFYIRPYIYDVLITDINVFIEVNGTLWHADPRFYKSDDILPRMGKRAQEIWDKDKKKLNLASSKGYKTVVLWEEDIKFLSDQQLFDYIYESINQTIKNNIH